jgi:hypothetical protein
MDLRRLCSKGCSARVGASPASYRELYHSVKLLDTHTLSSLDGIGNNHKEISAVKGHDPRIVFFGRVVCSKELGGENKEGNSSLSKDSFA